MENNEIFACIVRDIEDVNAGMFGVRDITIGMTDELFRRLCPPQFLLPKKDYSVTLFGCKVKVLPCRGLWWVVGYEGTAEEET